MSESTQEKKETRASFDMSACMNMMKEMMAQAGGEWDCSDMMSQIDGMDGIPDDWIEVMSQMMAFCGGKVEESEESE